MMSQTIRSVGFVLLVISALTLSVGGVCVALRMRPLAGAVWLAGASVVLLALTVSIAKAVLKRQIGIDVPAWLAIGLALVLGETLAAAVSALMVASGQALEEYAQSRARREMTALLRRAPRHATRWESCEWHAVSIDLVDRGDRLLVRSGEFVPVDGTLNSVAELDESMLTGEAQIRQRLSGESLCCGVVNVGLPF